MCDTNYKKKKITVSQPINDDDSVVEIFLYSTFYLQNYFSKYNFIYYKLNEIRDITGTCR